MATPNIVCKECGARRGAGAHRIFCSLFLTHGPVDGRADLVCGNCGFNWSPWCCESWAKSLDSRGLNARAESVRKGAQ